MQNLTWNDVKRKLQTVRSIFLPEAVLTFCYQVEVPLITVCFCLSKWRHPFQWVSQSITWMFQGWSFREAFGQQFQKPGLPFSINLIWIRINYRFISTRRDIFLESMIKTKIVNVRFPQPHVYVCSPFHKAHLSLESLTWITSTS